MVTRGEKNEAELARRNEASEERMNTSRDRVRPRNEVERGRKRVKRAEEARENGVTGLDWASEAVEPRLRDEAPAFGLAVSRVPLCRFSLAAALGFRCAL
jgi:hypothetical protein